MAESRTATGAAFCRLIEQSQPPGLRQFDDPVVGRLLDPMLTALAGAGPVQAQLLAGIGTGTYGCQVMRTRYIDDVVVAEAALDVTQLVLLGAGLDTRAYRLRDLRAVTVFEVGLPALQRRKQRRLRGTRPTAREVRFVPLDLDRQSLDAALIAAGFDRSRPVLVVWEGVTQYLTEAAVRSTLTFVGGSAAGSAIVFTYVLRSILSDDARGKRAELRRGIDSSEPWLFGLEPAAVPSFLAGFGLRLVEDVGDADYQMRYLRPAGRRLEVDPGERTAFAVV